MVALMTDVPPRIIEKQCLEMYAIKKTIALEKSTEKPKL